ncbi:MAG: phosphate/phosphite/phosphonate ABC transporter substrate-binding protein [Gammaproteobacteria bacterium]|nr:phosphate/phosphite/phosphonate ABC transporter substrate-binding protein [Gammaproteobacteria bacterium]
MSKLTKLIFKFSLLLAIPVAGHAGSITLGSLSSTPGSETTIFLPVASYLAKGLADFGITDARVRVARSHAEMADLMKQGEVDLFIDSSISALIVQRQSGGHFLARRWKKGISEYHSVIFVRKESGISQLKDLGGHTMGFEEPFSSSGYLLPASEMIRSGLSLVPVGQQAQSMGVGYRFTGADENTLLWVLHGRLDAGAMAGNKLAKLAASLQDELKVIYQSRTIPYHVVVVRQGLSILLQQAIHQRLLEMHNNSHGQQVLEAFEKTGRFDDIPANVLRNLQSIQLDPVLERQ